MICRAGNLLVAAQLDLVQCGDRLSPDPPLQNCRGCRSGIISAELPPCDHPCSAALRSLLHPNLADAKPELALEYMVKL